MLRWIRKVVETRKETPFLRWEDYNFTIRVGDFAVVCSWYPAGGLGWGLHKWVYMERSSWKHGTLYMQKVKVMW